MEKVIENLTVFGIGLAISIGLFLLLRSLLLWYWCIDSILKNQERQSLILKKQNELLEQIYLVLGGHKISGSKESKEEIERKAKLFDENNKK
jgi:hypothetical protein